MLNTPTIFFCITILKKNKDLLKYWCISDSNLWQANIWRYYQQTHISKTDNKDANFAPLLIWAAAGINLTVWHQI